MRSVALQFGVVVTLLGSAGPGSAKYAYPNEPEQTRIGSGPMTAVASFSLSTDGTLHHGKAAHHPQPPPNQHVYYAAP